MIDAIHACFGIAPDAPPHEVIGVAPDASREEILERATQRLRAVHARFPEHDPAFIAARARLRAAARELVDRATGAGDPDGLRVLIATAGGWNRKARARAALGCDAWRRSRSARRVARRAIERPSHCIAGGRRASRSGSASRACSIVAAVGDRFHGGDPCTCGHGHPHAGGARSWARERSTRACAAPGFRRADQRGEAVARAAASARVATVRGSTSTALSHSISAGCSRTHA